MHPLQEELLHRVMNDPFIWKLPIFTVVYIVIQLIVYVVLRIRQNKVTNLELKTFKNVRRAFEESDRESLGNYQINEIFEQEDERSKYVGQWQKYYKRVQNKKKTERLNVSPYFGPDALYRAVGDRQILNVGGGIHTSIGVLGTFIGLAYGLSGLSSLEPDVLKEGIQNLISGMTTAFFTSIVGLVLSLLWLRFDRSSTKRLEAAVDWHSNELSYLLDADDEELLLQRLEAISRQQAEQFTTALTDLMEQQFTPFSEQLFHNFTQMSEQLERQSELTSEQIELTRNQGSDLSSTLVASLQDSQESFVERLTSNVELMTSRFSELAEQLDEASRAYLQANEKNMMLLEQTESITEKLQPATEQMEAVATALHDSKDQLDVLQERQAELIPHLKVWNEDVLTYLKDFTALSDRQIGEVTQQVAYGKEQWESTAETFERTRLQLDETMEQFSEGLEKGLTTTFQTFEKELVTVVQHFKSLSGAYLESQEALTETMQQTVETLQRTKGRG